MPVRVTLINDDEITSRGVSAMLREHPAEIELVSLLGPALTLIDVALYDHATIAPGLGPSLADLVGDARIRKVVVFTWSFQPWCAVDFISTQAVLWGLGHGLGNPPVIDELGDHEWPERAWPTEVPRSVRLVR